jgi:hypothetical protein|tara:strand:+ start:26 stop:1255 length:1230 start_codon:yes stop_codon:yes gene_type:complete
MGQPVIAGGKIFRRPQEDLSGLFGGIGDIVGAIRSQRQQEKEAIEFTQFARVLGGELSPEGEAIGSAGSPQNAVPLQGTARLDALLNIALSPKIKSTKGRQRVNDLINAELARSKIAAGADPTQALIFTDPNTKQQSKIRGRRSLATTNPNVSLPPVQPNTDFEVIVDPVSKESFRVDLNDPTAEPVPLGVGGGSSGDDAGEGVATPSGEGESALTIQDLQLSTGPASAIKAGLARVFGSVIRGVQFRGTRDARAALESGNQAIRRISKIGERFTKFESEFINKTLDQTDRFFEDPARPLSNYLQIRDTVEEQIASAQSELQREDLSRKRREELLGRVSTRREILDLIPSRALLEHAIDSDAPINVDSFTSVAEIQEFLRETKGTTRFSREELVRIRQRAIALGARPDL